MSGAPSRPDREPSCRPSQTLPGTIRRLRGAMGWSQRALADVTGWDNATISRMESGRREIRVDEVVLLADVFGVDLADLMTGQPLNITIDRVTE